MPDVIQGLTLQRLVEAAREIIESEAEVDVSYIAPIKVNIQDFVERVREVLRERGETSYRELTRDFIHRVELIATFLALLELYNREEIDMRQAERVGEINNHAHKGV